MILSCSILRSTSILVVTLVAGGHLTTPSAEAQARRLQSRALFATLDSAAVAESSAMAPLNPRDTVDWRMLALLSFLDGRAGRDSGVPPTRIRYWDGYRTQAHPTLGILVDRVELKHLFDSLRSLKGMMGVPAAAIQQRISYVTLFLVAHEYGHLQQYQRFGIPAVVAPDSTRLIECGADLLGGAGYRSFLASLDGSVAWPKEALPAAVDFGHVVGSTDWLDGTDYPLAEHRRKCIEAGIEVATAGPRIHVGGVDIVDWSRLQARTILSQESVVDSSAVFQVVRDTSAMLAIRKLAMAAAKGEKELRKLRSGRAPDRGGLKYLLRDALPTPWKCTIGSHRGSETASCAYRTVGDPGAELARVEDMVSAAIAGADWTPVGAEVGSSPTDIQVVFAPRGLDPRSDRTARIDVLRHGPAEEEYAMTQAEIAVEFSIELLVRARH